MLPNKQYFVHSISEKNKFVDHHYHMYFIIIITNIIHAIVVDMSTTLQ